MSSRRNKSTSPLPLPLSPPKIPPDIPPSNSLLANSNIYHRKWTIGEGGEGMAGGVVGGGVHRDTIISDFDPTLEEPEIVELGLSHEIVNDELYLPSHPSRDWIHCYISTTGPGCYRMYLEGKKRVRFLLSAKQFSASSAFYISSSEDFPVLDNIPKSGYLARLEKQRDDSFLIILNQCHLCDVNLGFYQCGRGKTEREVIGRVYHYYRSFKPSNVEYRCISVMIPSISKTGKRKIWCPRAFRRANPSLGYDVDVNTAITVCKDVSFRFENQKPEWNEKAKSLVVKFQGNRVLIPSIRNFLLCTSWDTSILSASQMEDDEEDEEEEEEDGMRSYASRSVHENDIAPFMKSHDSNEDSRSSSPHSNSTAVTQPMSTASPVPLARQSSYSPPPSTGFHSPLLTRSQPTTPGQYPPPPPSASVTKSVQSNLPFPSHYPSHHRSNGRTRSESSIDSESTITTTSATPTMTSKSNRSIQIGSPKPTTPSTSKRKGFSRKESKVLDDNEPVLQFGKSTQTRYSLDFKFPLSPLQAFGIALSAFAFESMNHVKQLEKQQSAAHSKSQSQSQSRK